MKWHTILPLVAKDLKLFFRNRFYAFATVLGLVGFVALYLLMPRTVDEIMKLGLYAPSTSELVAGMVRDEGLELRVVGSEETLRQAVLDGDVAAGIALPDGLLQQLGAGLKPTAHIYLPSASPRDTQEMMVVLVESLALSLSGNPLSIEVQEQTLGPDMAGVQVPPRDRMLPLFALFVLMVETMGLASLIAEEIQAGTLRALLVTPLGVRELFLGKGITSVAMTFTQATLLMLLIGGLKAQPLVILTTLLLGSLLVTGIGFLMASVGRDMLSVMGLGVLVMVLLGVPAFGVLFPGTVTVWAKLIPTHYLAETVHLTANLGAGWAQVWRNLLILLGADALLFGLGAFALKRRFT